jgi:hypothetical protein
VWNTQWLLIIPGISIASPADEGLNLFIKGQPVPGNPGQRDGNGVKDIILYLDTYSNAGL